MRGRKKGSYREERKIKRDRARQKETERHKQKETDRDAHREIWEVPNLNNLA